MTNLFPCTARLCANISGVGPATDVTIYSLQDRLFFNGVPLSFLVTCPEGYYCPPGSFPRVITYPPGTFVIPQPTPGGFPIVLQLQGCQSLVSRTLPSDATEAQIQAAANEIILEVGQQQAECDSQPPPAQELPETITLSEIAAFFCLEETWDVTISTDAPSSALPLTFLVITGDLPSGIVQSQSASEFFLTGAAAAMGTYNFTVACGGTNAYGQQAYSVVVGGITTASPLPSATVGDDYTEVLTSNLTGALIWSVVGGLTTLPEWLNFNETTGTLFGTPPEDSEGTFSFTISVSNGVNTCEKDFELEVEGGEAEGCELFEEMSFNAVSTILNGDAGADSDWIDYPGEGREFYAQASAGSGGGDATVTVDGSFEYTGPEFSCEAFINITGLTATSEDFSMARVKLEILSFTDGELLFELQQTDLGGSAGQYTLPFTVPASTGAIIYVSMEVAADSQAGQQASATASFRLPKF